MIHIALVCAISSAIILLALVAPHAVLIDHRLVEPFLMDGAGTIAKTLLLTWQPEFFDILPLYAVLLLWLPALLWLCRIDVRLAMTLSVLVWYAANAFGLNMPGSRNGGWYFNPFAWQLLFSIGVVIGLDARARGADVITRRSPIVLTCAVLFLAFSMIYTAPWTQIPIAELRQWRPIPAELFGTVSKTNLSLWRLAHVLCLAYVAACCVGRRAPWLSSWWAARLSELGRHSLSVFVLASVASVTGHLVLLETGNSLANQLIINLAGLTVLASFGHLKIEREKRRQAPSWPGMQPA
jgi:hypothetical protein